MATKNNKLTITAQARDETSKALKKIAKEFEKTQEAAEIQNVKGTMGAAKFAGALGKVKGAAGVVAIALTAVATATTVAIAAGKEYADQSFKLAKNSAELQASAQLAAETLGASTEFVTGWGYAAKQAGVDQHDFSEAITELVAKATTNRDDFKKWGVEVTDSSGRMKDAEGITRALADRMSQLGSASERTAIAGDLMEDSARKLIPVMQGGSRAIDEMVERNRALGGEISSTEALIGTRFIQQLTDMETSFQGTSRTLGSTFQPALTVVFENAQVLFSDMTSRIFDSRDAYEEFATRSIAVLVRGFRFLVQAASAASHVLEGIVSIFTFKLGPAFDEARLMAEKVADQSLILAGELERGAVITQDDVVPAVRAENAARSALVETLNKERGARKSLAQETADELGKVEQAIVAAQDSIKSASQLAGQIIIDDAQAVAVAQEFLAQQQLATALASARAFQGKMSETQATLTEEQRRQSALRKNLERVEANIRLESATGFDTARSEAERAATQLAIAESKKRAAAARAELAELKQRADEVAATIRGAAEEATKAAAVANAATGKAQDDQAKKVAASLDTANEKRKLSAEEQEKVNEKMAQFGAISSVVGNLAGEVFSMAISGGLQFQQILGHIGLSVVKLGLQFIMVKAAEAAASAFAANSGTPVIGLALGAAAAAAAFAAVSALQAKITSGGGGGGGGGRAKRFARGGEVPGTGRGDRVHAILEAGETVWTRDETEDFKRNGSGGGGPLVVAPPPGPSPLATDTDVWTYRVLIPALERAGFRRS